MRSFTLFIHSFVRSFLRSFVSSFVPFGNTITCLWINSVLFLLFFHSHSLLLTRVFFSNKSFFFSSLSDSIFTNHVYINVCLIFIASTFFLASVVVVLEFKMNLCMQHPSYFCSSSLSAHTKEKKKWQNRVKQQLFKKMTFRL